MHFELLNGSESLRLDVKCSAQLELEVRIKTLQIGPFSHLALSAVISLYFLAAFFLFSVAFVSSL